MYPTQLCILAASAATLYGSLTNYPDDPRACGSTVPDTNIFYSVWLSIIVYDCVIVIMTLIKTVPTLEFRASTPVLTQLMRDGVLYFIIMFVASVANLVAVRALPAYSMMLYTFYRVVTVSLGSRLILNLRMQILRPMGAEDLSPKLDKLVFNALQSRNNSLDDIEDPEGAQGRRRAMHHRDSNAESGPGPSTARGRGRLPSLRLGTDSRPSVGDEHLMMPLMELDQRSAREDANTRSPPVSPPVSSAEGGHFDVTEPLMNMSDFVGRATPRRSLSVDNAHRVELTGGSSSGARSPPRVSNEGSHDFESQPLMDQKTNTARNIQTTMTWTSPLQGYENAEPLPDTVNPDGKSLFNPPRLRSAAYDQSPKPIDSSNNEFDFHSVAAEAKFAKELHERLRREFPELRIYKFWDKAVGKPKE
ncbi:hypothetical protein HWV62_27567 [Athelia sp. TMB]|nr:hypothetical protein HWV62_27567 [Athelia sp. TMB]